MKYLRPRLPEKEIELCLDLFDKNEAKERILKYIEGVFDDAERQLKNCSIPAVVVPKSTLCECEYPIIRQDLTEYCSICQKEVK